MTPQTVKPGLGDFDGTPPAPLDLISLILPVYNEKDVIPLLLPSLQRLLERLPCKAEVIFVNDGSRDGSGVLLAEAARTDDRIKVIEFSRNFGHQVAITAGTDFAEGDAVVVMDADLQDPPELVLQMIEKYLEGNDVVYAQRVQRHGDSWFKRTSAAGFYWLMRHFVHKDLPDNTGDFRLMSRPVVESLRQMREQYRFVRGMVAWVGFRQVALPFERPPRAAGETKYPLRKMLAFAWRAITSFSGLPLRMAIVGGLIMIGAAVLYALYASYQALVLGITAVGWTSLVCLQVGLTGLTFLFLGLMGDYISRIYDEMKGRPLYLIRNLVNCRLRAKPTWSLPANVERGE